VADLKAAVDAFSAARTAKADPPCEWLPLGRRGWGSG